MDFVLPDQGFHWTDLNFLLIGAGHTLLVSIISGAIGTFFGILLGWLRQALPVVRVITTPYVDVTRSVPLIIQLILANSIIAMSGAQFSTFWLSIIVLSSSMTVVTSEVVRGALSTVPYAYVRASRSLGIGYFQTLMHISAPLALRMGLSAWIGLLLGLTRDTALVSVVGYVDFMKSAQILISRTNETLPLLLGVGLFYFVICFSVSRYSAHLQKGIAS
ncbi:putative permease of ABC transporter [Candidatus Burkholderia verschuerenii]|uniref:Putative permease of ABC transporter n=1 Tax=Candidatus Burkholderia verschuerenii TaxID=242163 RepID=A0A0L0MF85_9BURK|nr:amino acid ABC transporter permease [Candidatus Burkholderia verschuerenii]KND60609.1 putative permease of ABC transporter [Candidatus Burkholderia verschuerenii]